MADYIRALEPVTEPAQLVRTKAIIQQFTAPNALGPRLHQYLLDRREAEDNWGKSKLKILQSDGKVSDNGQGQLND
uniref:Carn_acyltransf domain-containing protein n=1 Tax=Glossina austeni TaxID=7395 RepID=A0A1A9VPP6_GLOAU